MDNIQYKSDSDSFLNFRCQMFHLDLKMSDDQGPQKLLPSFFFILYNQTLDKSAVFILGFNNQGGGGGGNEKQAFYLILIFSLLCLYKNIPHPS